MHVTDSHRARSALGLFGFSYLAFAALLLARLALSEMIVRLGIVELRAILPAVRVLWVVASAVEVWGFALLPSSVKPRALMLALLGVGTLGLLLGIVTTTLDIVFHSTPPGVLLAASSVLGLSEVLVCCYLVGKLGNTLPLTSIAAVFGTLRSLMSVAFAFRAAGAEVLPRWVIYISSGLGVACIGLLGALAMHAWGTLSREESAARRGPVGG